MSHNYLSLVNVISLLLSCLLPWNRRVKQGWLTDGQKRPGLLGLGLGLEAKFSGLGLETSGLGLEAFVFGLGLGLVQSEGQSDQYSSKHSVSQAAR